MISAPAAIAAAGRPIYAPRHFGEADDRVSGSAQLMDTGGVRSPGIACRDAVERRIPCDLVGARAAGGAAIALETATAGVEPGDTEIRRRRPSAPPRHAEPGVAERRSLFERAGGLPVDAC